jgi:RNA polymerase sigma factor FliA
MLLRLYMSPEQVRQLTERYIPHVHAIVNGMRRRLPPWVATEDLAHAGVVGLLAALRAFDSRRGDFLEAYVVRRVRGAILDELRTSDPLSRTQRRDLRKARAAARSLEAELGRNATSDEIAERSGLAEARVRTVERLAHAAASPPTAEPSCEATAYDSAAIAELRRRLADRIGNLPSREQTVLSLYYHEELSLREIGKLLGVTESRACQIHGSAVRSLRAALGD